MKLQIADFDEEKFIAILRQPQNPRTRLSRKDKRKVIEHVDKNWHSFLKAFKDHAHGDR